PILHTVLFRQSGRKLTLASCDGFRLAVNELPFEEGENEAKVDIDDLKGLIPALKKAKRVRLWFESWQDKPEHHNLVIETELVKYRYRSLDGDFPEYDSFIPHDEAVQASVRFDTSQAAKSVNSLASLWFNHNITGKERPIIITTTEGKLIFDTKDERGKTEIEAEVEGEGRTAIQAGYLSQALKACNGMVDFKIGNPQSASLFSVNGYRLIQMPMLVSQANAVSEAEAIAAQAEEKGQAEEENPEQGEGQTQAEGQPEPEAQKPEAKPKSKSKSKKKGKAKEPVAV
ncbi:MAG: hypothetical protein GY867_07265, partial [bacterium]|nr:hypothetical protein [bacterium]